MNPFERLKQFFSQLGKTTQSSTANPTTSRENNPELWSKLQQVQHKAIVLSQMHSGNPSSCRGYDIYPWSSLDEEYYTVLAQLGYVESHDWGPGGCGTLYMITIEGRRTLAKHLDQEAGYWL